MREILHVISQLSRGGASRSLVAIAAQAARLTGDRHRVVSLLEPGAGALALAERAGLAVLSQPDADTVDRAVAKAAIVQLHFWNTPELYALVRRPLPPMRTLLWSDVFGDTPPHVLTDTLVGWADAVVATCAGSSQLPVLSRAGDQDGWRTSMVLNTPDFERLAHVAPRAHAGFNVGYIGTVDFVKMHPDFVAMSAAVDVPGARFVVCGGGGGFRELVRQAQALGAADRFDFRGYLEDLAPVLEVLDVFGYPIADYSYGTADLALQEAMYAGVPPVVFAPDGVHPLVDDDVNGLVARSGAQYSRAIERLAREPETRGRLGAAAAERARTEFGAATSARRLVGVYDRLMRSAKRLHRWPNLPATGAARFVESLGGSAPEFAASLASERDEAAMGAAIDADARIAAARPPMVDAGGGGILRYRRAEPDDGHVRLWSGLVLMRAGRFALAAAEFTAARARGLEEWRVGWYLAQAALGAGSAELARTELESVVRRAPAFLPARDLLAAQFHRP
jgi:glycosyltransferase involved in cell wall biosynthesis